MPPLSPILHKLKIKYDTLRYKEIRSNRFNYSIIFASIINTRHVLKESIIRIYNVISLRRSIYNPNIKEKRVKKSKVRPKDIR